MLAEIAIRGAGPFRPSWGAGTGSGLLDRTPKACDTCPPEAGVTRHKHWQAARAFALVAGLVLPGIRTAAASEPVVRVLLETTSRAVEVGLPGGSRQQIRPAAGGGLRTPSGSLPSGSVWQSPRRGLHEFGKWRFEGQLRVHRDPEGLRVIALVPLERYVEGAIGREMPSSWDAEALRAQAIVSRTYALRALRKPAAPIYDVEASTVSQVFGGADAAVPSVRAAAAATRGQYLALNGEPILAVFHSASGGRTAGAEEVWGDPVPYLRSQVVEEEEEGAVYLLARGSCAHHTPAGSGSARAGRRKGSETQGE